MSAIVSSRPPASQGVQDSVDNSSDITTTNVNPLNDSTITSYDAVVKSNPQANKFKTSNLGVRLDLELKPQAGYVAGTLKGLRGAVSKKKFRFKEGDFDLDLTYITPRIIAMGFPSVGREGIYRNPLSEVQRFFESRHSGHYKVYNLCSERAYDPEVFVGRVARYPFDDHNPCFLHVISDFCKDVDEWFAQHPDNVIAVHCKAGKGRTGLMISAYLMHCGIRPTAESALIYYGGRRTANGKGVTIPSQMRYVHYYERVLHQGFPVTYTYRLQWIRFRGIPNMDMSSGYCAPYFTVFQDSSLAFDFKKASGGSKKLQKFKKGEGYMDLDCTPFDIRLANNLRFQFYHDGVAGVTKMCHLWFHTGFVTRNYLVFGKSVIDKACKDKKGLFPPNFAIEMLLQRIDSPPMPNLKGPQNANAVD